MNIDLLKVFDDRDYASMALELREKYATAHPFSHIVIDNFLPAQIANSLAEAYPAPELASSTALKTHSNENVERSFIENVEFLPDDLRLFSAAATSRNFLLFLETLTGIEALLPDPYFIGGGAMMTGRGGHLNIHTDFNWHHKLQTWRQVNALFYLTPDWKEEWMGDLEFWSTDGKTKVQSVSPKFNRCVIFTTTSESFHGQPAKLQCPPGVFRKVFSLFYYSTKRGPATLEDPHFTKYATANSPYSDSLLKDYKAKS